MRTEQVLKEALTEALQRWYLCGRMAMFDWVTSNKQEQDAISDLRREITVVARKGNVTPDWASWERSV